MVLISQDQLKAFDLYEAMHQIDGSFCGIFEGGSGVGDLGHVIPFDDAVDFANAYGPDRSSLSVRFIHV